VKRLTKRQLEAADASELLDAMHECRAARNELRDYAVELKTAYDARVAAERATETVEQLSDVERAALTIALNTGEVETAGKL
jgi:hypothetical protein